MMSEWGRLHRDRSSAVVESEHIVEAEEACWTTRKKVEDLSKLDWVLTTINEQIAWDEAEDAVVNWWLSVKALNNMLNLAERAELFNDWCNTFELLTFKAEHRVVSVKLLELLFRLFKSFYRLRVCWCRTRCSSAQQIAVQLRRSPSLVF